MKRIRAVLTCLLAAGFFFVWLALRNRPVPEAPQDRYIVISQPDPKIPSPPTAAEALLEGYGASTTEPIEDLRKLHRALTGYFSVMKDPSRFPIGGNADLAAALRGENANREVFVHEGHALFNKDGLIKDRWGNPLIVHPEGWRQIELRSAGPDGIGYNGDDVVLSPTGVQVTK